MMQGILLTTAGGFLLLSAEPALPVAVATAIGIGFAGGGIMPVYTMLLALRFGPESLGRAFGLTNVFLLPLGFGLPPLAGLVVANLGSYALALWAIVGLYLVGGVLLLRVRGPFRR